jgi:dTDP-4-dehydrorhamnose 3,5-epimerase
MTRQIALQKTPHMPLDVQPDTVFPDVLLVRPARHKDARGWFSEVYSEAAFADAGITCRFVQDNHSYSAAAGTLRGLHFQAPPHAQAKLVRCMRGSILDIIVDIRHGSPTFGQHTRLEISRENGLQVLVPEGFAHGFCTLEKASEVAYRVSRPYAPEADRGLAFDDPALGIDWPMPAAGLILSDRDRKHPPLSALTPAFADQGARP